MKDWPAAATTNPDRVERWWPTNNPSRYGLAIATGPSQLVVIDCDVKTDEQGRHISGIHALAELQADHSLIGPTYTVDTPSGGRHYYLTAPTGDAVIRNSAGKLAEGVDIRAAGGYVVAAPTITTAGAYTVTNHSSPTALPSWVEDLICTPTVTSPPAQLLEIPTWRIDPYVAAALRGEVERVEAARPGQRNHTLYRAANNLGQLVGAGVLDEHQVETALNAAYQRHIAAGADSPEQSTKTIRSGINHGRQKPRAINRTGTRTRSGGNAPSAGRLATSGRTTGDRGPPQPQNRRPPPRPHRTSTPRT